MTLFELMRCKQAFARGFEEAGSLDLFRSLTDCDQRSRHPWECWQPVRDHEGNHPAAEKAVGKQTGESKNTRPWSLVKLVKLP